METHPPIRHRQLDTLVLVVGSPSRGENCLVDHVTDVNDTLVEAEKPTQERNDIGREPCM